MRYYGDDSKYGRRITFRWFAFLRPLGIGREIVQQGFSGKGCLLPYLSFEWDIIDSSLLSPT